MTSKFISESEAAEERKRRQQEWERVRNPDDPLERPEEIYDPRSLYEKLQDQKQKKELEYEEAHKLKNMIKGLDDDEVDFLEMVDRTKQAEDRKKELEEERALNEFRHEVASLQEKTVENRLNSELLHTKIHNSDRSTNLQRPLSTQQKLVKSVILPKKRKLVENVNSKETTDESKKVFVQGTGLQCVAVLPGLGYYDNSSSDNTSDCDSENSASEHDNLLSHIVGKKCEEMRKNE